MRKARRQPGVTALAAVESADDARRSAERVTSEIAAGVPLVLLGTVSLQASPVGGPGARPSPRCERGQQLSMSLARVGESDMVRHRMGTANDLKMLLLWRSSF